MGQKLQQRQRKKAEVKEAKIGARAPAKIRAKAKSPPS